MSHRRSAALSRPNVAIVRFNLTGFPSRVHESEEVQAKRNYGRKLGAHIGKGKCLRAEFDKRGYIEKYIPHIGIALQEILDLSNAERDKTVATLDDVLQKSRKF